MVWAMKRATNWTPIGALTTRIAARLMARRQAEILGRAEIAAPAGEKAAVTARGTNDDGGSARPFTGRRSRDCQPAGRGKDARPAGGANGPRGAATDRESEGSSAKVIQIAKAGMPRRGPSVDGPVICPTHHAGPSFDSKLANTMDAAAFRIGCCSIHMGARSQPCMMDVWSR